MFKKKLNDKSKLKSFLSKSIPRYFRFWGYVSLNQYETVSTTSGNLLSNLQPGWEIHRALKKKKKTEIYLKNTKKKVFNLLFLDAGDTRRQTLTYLKVKVHNLLLQ